MDFVDRVLALQGDSPIHKFSLKIEDGNDPVDPNHIFSWILNVLQRGVLDLDLCMDLIKDCQFPAEIFMSETLVRLRLNNGYGPTIDFEDVNLPKLKSLHMDSAHLEKSGIGLSKLLSGCHMLEDLVLDEISTCLWDFSSVYVTTLKKLTYGWGGRDENTKSVSFDTLNLVYLEYVDTIANKYPKVNFGTLVEARINLRISDDQIWDVRIKAEASSSDHSESDEENDMDEEENTVVNATVFIMGLSNVKILYLSANTLE
ncbi:hypothetical protein AALP_AA2G099400 [Arabis alpina]|uniref:F-box/LRR-repeat protein 15/At3g58940/PEG3-like LRR domain-containing protein n=1 Tax=Arabis alpina TaxID=50452 RepID=A0A087HGF6_ARAAL|nr:hypothetical protein AALP_AA2G099400 [Arabis alpina]